MNEKRAERLYDQGFTSAAELAAADIEEVMTASGLEEEEAAALITAARQAAEAADQETDTEEDADQTANPPAAEPESGAGDKAEG